jgi:hypothetical protein
MALSSALAENEAAEKVRTLVIIRKIEHKVARRPGRSDGCF